MSDEEDNESDYEQQEVGLDSHPFAYEPTCTLSPHPFTNTALPPLSLCVKEEEDEVDEDFDEEVRPRARHSIASSVICMTNTLHR